VPVGGKNVELEHPDRSSPYYSTAIPGRYRDLSQIKYYIAGITCPIAYIVLIGERL